MFAEIIEYLFLFGAVHGILLSVFLLSQKKNHVANVVLSVAMALFALDLLQSYYYLAELYYKYPHWIGITFGFPYLYAILIYLFTVIITSNKNIFDKKFFWHFIPYFITVVYGLLFVYFIDSKSKITFINRKHTDVFIYFLSYSLPLYGTIYTYLALKKVKKYNLSLKDNYSNIDKINLDWLYHVTSGAMIVWIIVVISYLASPFIFEPKYEGVFIYVGLAVFIYATGYKALKLPNMIKYQNEPAEITADIDEEIKLKDGGYKKSGLKEEDALQYLKALEDLMDGKKPYLQSGLTLDELAEMLSITRHNLSEVLNTRIEKTFYDFVNEYRIEEVKKRIKNGDLIKFNILSIAFDAGFSSKSSFNKVFKKITGQTPSEFSKLVT